MEYTAIRSLIAKINIAVYKYSVVFSFCIYVSDTVYCGKYRHGTVGYRMIILKDNFIPLIYEEVEVGTQGDDKKLRIVNGGIDVNFRTRLVGV